LCLELLAADAPKAAEVTAAYEKLKAVMDVNVKEGDDTVVDWDSDEAFEKVLSCFCFI